MGTKTNKSKPESNKRRQYVKRIYTSNQCLPFMNHRYKKYDLTKLQFKIRSSVITDDFKQPELHFTKKMKSLKEDEWIKIKETVLKKFDSKPKLKSKPKQKPVYDMYGSLQTAKQKQAFDFEQTVLKQHFELDYDISHFKLLYGKNKLRRIKRIILKEMIRGDEEPFTVNIRPRIKVQDAIVAEVKKIASDDNFFGGVKRIQQILAEHDDSSIKVDLAVPSIRKILRRCDLYYKNLKVVKRTLNSKPGPSLEQKRDLARIIFYLLFKGYIWVNEDEVFMVNSDLVLFTY